MVNLNLLWNKLPTYRWGTYYVLNWMLSMAARTWDGNHEPHIISCSRIRDGCREIQMVLHNRESTCLFRNQLWKRWAKSNSVTCTHLLSQSCFLCRKHHAVRNGKMSLKMKFTSFYSSFWQESQWRQSKSWHSVPWSWRVALKIRKMEISNRE